MKIASVAEMRLAEERANAAGYSFEDMMEAAGLRVAELAEQLLADGRREGTVVVLAGPGRNGGDGLVAARHLAAGGHRVYVHLAREREEDDRQWQGVARLGIPYAVGEELPALESLTKRLDESALVIDALLGTGSRPPLRGEVSAILARLRDWSGARRLQREPLLWVACPRCHSNRPLVLAVDVPSGMDADTGEVDPLTPAADVTVAVASPKPGLFAFPGAERVGRLVVADIGIEPMPVGAGEPELLTADMVRAWLPARPRDGHKGTFGSTLVVAGSVNYVGAGLLAAAGAARTGCGLVTLASVTPVVAAADALVPEATRLHLPGEMGVIGPEAVAVLRAEWSRYQAVLLGPGLTQEKPAQAFVSRLLIGEDAASRSAIGFVHPGAGLSGERTKPGELPPLVVDADALNILAGERELLSRLPAGSIVTPHPGEMARLLQREVAAVQADRVDAARQAASLCRAVAVLKGAFTVIAEPEGRVAVAPFANPALATAGTGDVLAGVVASLVAQGLSPFAAACSGVYLHGLAGEMASAEVGAVGVVAHDLLTCLPRAYSDLAW